MTAIEISEDRLKWLETISLKNGSHGSLSEGVCAMEAVAYLAHEPHSDSPQCASPVIAQFMRSWNDALDDEGRQNLKPYLPRLIGTKASAEIEQQRGWMCADWLVRHHTPAWLELGGCKAAADALRALPVLTNLAALKNAQPAMERAVRDGAAAWDAAWAAAWGAAGAAAWDAAWAAAWGAARAAAGAAAKKRLEPIRLSLQDSAFELLERMIALTATEAQ